MKYGAIVVVIAFVFGILSYQEGTIKLNVPQFGTQQDSAKDKEEAAATAGLACPTDGDTTVGATVRNPLNATLFYSAQTVRAIDATTGKQISTMTSTQSTSTIPAYGTANLGCGSKLEYVILGTTTINSAKLTEARLQDGSMSKVVTGANAYVDFEINHAGGLKAMITDANLNNLTVGDGTSGSFAVSGGQSSAAQAIASGDSKTYHLKVMANTSFTTFGTKDYKPILCVDANPSVYSKSEGIGISGGGATQLTDVPNSVPSGDGMDSCWAIEPLTTNEIDYTISVKADLGEPGSSDDITYRFYDLQLYSKKDGSIGTGYTDDAVARIGLNDDNWLLQVS